MDWIPQSQECEEQAEVMRYIVVAVVAILHSQCIGPIVDQVQIPLSITQEAALYHPWYLIDVAPIHPHDPRARIVSL